MSAIPGPVLDHVRSLERPQPSAKDSSFYDPPDTTICRKAVAFIKGHLPDWLTGHCLRTYAFSLAVANYAGWDSGDAAQRLGFDRELIFLACVLHELGFETKKGLNSPMSLELWGGIKAREWILQQSAIFQEENLPAKQLENWADEACEAIVRHTIEFRGFSKRCRVTLACVVLGSGHDLMGLCEDFVHPDDTRLICERWPRNGYCQGLRAHSQLEVERKPACLLEDCLPCFDPCMFDVEIFKGIQGEMKVDPEWEKRKAALPDL